MESGQRRKKKRRNGVGGEETRTEGGGRMDGERTEEPTKGMEAPSKARRQKEDNSNMGGKGCEAWIPVFGAASAMDYVALANLAVTSHEMKKVCEDEILMRKECELGHVQNPSFSKQGWRRPIRRLNIRMPQANMDRFAAEYGMTTCVVLISVLDRQT